MIRKREEEKLLLLILTIIMLFNTSIFSKSFWRKPIYFTSVKGERDSAIIWDLHLGAYNVNFVREYPGGKRKELKDALVDVMINIYGEFLSYRCPVGDMIYCEPHFEVDFGKGIEKVGIDSIEYIFCNGSKVKLRDGKIGELFINIEGNRVKIKEMILEKYILDEKREKSLKSAGFYYLTFFSFTKGGLKEAERLAKECVTGNKK